MGKAQGRPADPDATSDGLEDHRNGLLAMAMRLTRWDRAKAEDLVQMALVRAISAKAGDANWTYLQRALMSAFLDDQRSFWHRYFTTMIKLPEVPRENPIVEKIQSGRISRALKDQLSDTEYTALMMWAEGYSAKEICKHLRLSPSTYPHVLARAKESLQAWLDQDDPSASARRRTTPSTMDRTR